MPIGSGIVSNAILFVDFDGVFHAMDSRDFEYCGNALVVHSSWRHLYPAEELIARFPAVMQPRIVGVTEGRERHQSILNYVCMNDVTRFAVLDDSPEAFPKNWPNLIVCDSQRGINDDVVLSQIRRFVEG